MNLNNTTKILAIGLFTLSIPSSANALEIDFPWKNNNQNKTQIDSQSKTQKYPTSSTNKKIKSFMSVFQPPTSSNPMYTVGGAVRSGDICTVDSKQNKQMTALVSASSQALTTKSHPDLFAYIPPMEEAKKATLVVKDAPEDYYYSQDITVSKEGGIVKINLDKNAPPLEMGTEYSWFLRIQCDKTQFRIEDPYIGATIKRVEAPNSLANSQDLNQSVALFSKSGIWYDSLSSAHSLAVDRSQNTYWQELLNSVGMKKFVNEQML